MKFKVKLAEMDGAFLSIAQTYRKVKGEEKGLADALPVWDGVILEQGISL